MSHSCPECGDTFDTKTKVKMHYGNSHEGSIAGIEVVCHTCGSEFTKNPTNARNAEKHFCDESCYTEYKKETYSGEGNPSYAGRVQFECEECGAGFELPPSRAEQEPARFCSCECAGTHRARERNDFPKSKNREEEGLRYPYGDYWGDQREKALERDGNECVECGRTDGLEVHHIKRAKSFTSRKKAHRLENLKTLCTTCHGKADAA
jgi:5-methylcytosine-specific restriction endonuclease McrA